MGSKLDLKDKKLLSELDLDSRQSFNNLAKKLRISKNAIIYRVNNLKKVGIIKQFHTVVDTGKLGFIGFRIYLKLQNTDKKKEEEIIKFFKQKEIVTWVVSIEGDYNLGALILVRTIKEINDLWNELLQKYGNYLDERLLTIMTHVSYFSRAYLLDKQKNDYEITIISEPDEVKLDELDWKILQILVPNARAQIIEIAHKLKVTPKTIISRIKELERKKIIVGYKTVFDLEKIGYQYFKIHFSLHNTTKEKVMAFRTFVKNHPNIIYDDEVLGGDDFEIEVQLKGTEELRKLIENIKEKFANMIKEYKTMIYYKEHKYLLLPVKDISSSKH
ncbi:MAG: Lrp/AsnC family transcriptional regulator [archaeon]